MRTRVRGFDAAAYWHRRYADGRTSGAGSEGTAAVAKAKMIDEVITGYGFTSVIDWGVGDGVVLGHLRSQVPYLGIDVAPVAVELLQARYGPEHPTRRFGLLREGAHQVRDLALSLDVLFHLVDDSTYQVYLASLFGSARAAVLIHANDHDGGRTARHVLWRHWTPDVARLFPDWVPALAPPPGEREEPGWHLYLRRECI